MLPVGVYLSGHLPQVGALSDVTLIAAGFGDLNNGHACAAKQDGTLWCWGDDDCGQLGSSASSSMSADPVLVDPMP